MTSGDETRFATTGPAWVPDRKLLPLRLAEPAHASAHVHHGDEGIVFDSPGWYEVLLRVDWDPENTQGTRLVESQRVVYERVRA